MQDRTGAQPSDGAQGASRPLALVRIDEDRERAAEDALRSRGVLPPPRFYQGSFEVTGVDYAGLEQLAADGATDRDALTRWQRVTDVAVTALIVAVFAAVVWLSTHGAPNALATGGGHP